MGNKPDCAYFLLLGLCGAAFLLTIGGILTYVAFNPGMDGHPHSAMSHIPHFHHHSHHLNPHHQAQNYHHFNPSEAHHNTNIHPHSQNHNNSFVHVSHNVTVNQTLASSSTLMNLSTHDSTTMAGSTNTTDPNPSKELNSSPSTSPPIIPRPVASTTPASAHNSNMRHDKVQHQLHPVSNSSAAAIQAAFDAKAKQSLVLAIIGPLCLLMGIIVTLIVGVLALKYPCDEVVEPNISFLRLRSEMSLNFDPDKNNYELLRPSSSIEQAGGHFSINPTGLPESS